MGNCIYKNDTEKELYSIFKSQNAKMIYCGDGKMSEKCLLNLDSITNIKSEHIKNNKEIFTFHGTDPKNIKSIFENGFDIKYLGSNTGNEGLMGKGIYSSTNIEQAIYYCYDTKNGYIERKNFQLIVCKVLLGRIRNINDQIDNAKYDSCMDYKTGEIVVFDNKRIIPYCKFIL